MTLLEKINNLTWYDLINKLKDILKGLNDKPSGSEPPYKVYTALLSQSGTDAPVATVLENTLGGDVIWSYDDAGYYTGTLTGSFINEKTFCLIQNYYTSPGNINYFYRNNNNTLIVETKVSGVGEDGELFQTSIEIRVYN